MSCPSCKTIDQKIAARMRNRRTELGFSTTSLGAAIGVTYQQVCKYERCVNRVSASRLYQIAAQLNVPITYFFDDLSSRVTAQV